MAGPMTPDDERHEEVASLLGVHALDAVDADERALVEAHLLTCARCRAEVDDHLEVAAALAGSDVAPEGLWDRIAGSLVDRPPPEVIPLDRMRPAAQARRSQRAGGRRWIGVAAAAAVVAVVVAGAASTIAEQDQQIDDLADRVESAEETSEVRVAQLVDAGGVTTVNAVVEGDHGFVLADGLQPLEAGLTYQLWGIRDGRTRSLGLLGGEPSLETFQMEEGVTTLAITREESPGATQPTSDPLVAGDLI